MMNCQDCGGTILPHAISGATRGSCHCPRGPGRVIARLYYSTDQRPGGGREYDVEWEGRVVAVDPPTLAQAVSTLNALRTEWNAQRLNINARRS